MCLKEMGAALAGWRVEIIATDLSHGSAREIQVRHLQPVRGAARPADSVAGQVFQAERRDSGRSVPSCARMVQHRQLNLLHDFSQLGTFDVIFCRNVLIYFDQDTKINIFDRLARQMEGDGFLVLGAAETVVGLTDVFKPFPDKRGLYRPSGVRAASAAGRSVDAENRGDGRTVSA